MPNLSEAIPIPNPTHGRGDVSSPAHDTGGKRVGFSMSLGLDATKTLNLPQTAAI